MCTGQRQQQLQARSSLPDSSRDSVLTEMPVTSETAALEHATQSERAQPRTNAFQYLLDLGHMSMLPDQQRSLAIRAGWRTLLRITDHTAEDYFEPAAWEHRYAGGVQHWSGAPNAQLVAVLAGLTPGTALDVGCGEGGNVIWLAQQGWHVTGADFAANGLARAARGAEEAGVAERVDWWRVDARDFDAVGRTWDLVTTHFLHPPDAGMVAVTRRLASAVAPGGHLLVVGHAPSESFDHLTAEQRRAMWLAEDLLSGLPADFEVRVLEQRPRSMTREGPSFDVEDSTLFAQRRA